MTDREKWLMSRRKGIGGSDAAAILGISPYKSNIQLWEEKVGLREPEDIGDKLCVQYGKESEQHLRALFALDYPQYRVDYDEFGLVANCKECPFLFATLDGDISEMDDSKPLGLIKRKGILEVKTTEIMRGGQMAEWKDKIPQNYFIQVLHQFLATGYAFAVVKAQIKLNFDNNLRLDTRHYHIERSDVLDDLKFLKAAEIKFWHCVETKTRPALILPEI